MNSVATVSSFKKSDVRHLAVYRYSIELFTLSRKLKENHHIDQLRHCCHLSAKEAFELSNTLSLVVLSLPYTIAEAAVTIDLSKKITFQGTIAQRLDLARNTLLTLEKLYKKDNNSIHALRKTIVTLDHTFKNWTLGLTCTN